MKNKIEIYTNKTCPYCKAVKTALENDSIEFIEKDTTEFKEEWNKVANFTAIPTVPTIYYKNRYCNKKTFLKFSRRFHRVV